MIGGSDQRFVVGTSGECWASQVTRRIDRLIEEGSQVGEMGWTGLGWWGVRVAVALLLLIPVVGTGLSLLRHPHWGIRNWDAPRRQILAWLLIGVFFYALGAKWGWGWTGFDALVLGPALVAAAWQMWKILPYTPLARPTVPRSRLAGRSLGQGRLVAEERVGHPTLLRLVISNVQMENRQFERWLSVIEAEDPDVLLIVECDEKWLEAIHPRLVQRLPHHHRQPQENHYGMAIWSRLPLSDTAFSFFVQEDIPSLRTKVTLPGGQCVALYGLHPRPPEPIRDNSSAPRDAELVLVAREVRRSRAIDPLPTIVCGDLNDVAWSPMTELFCRLSGLQDPRRGRGTFSTFPAGHRLLHIPLDHVFHSGDFHLVDLAVLGEVGSDHLPVRVTLQWRPEAAAEQSRSPVADAATEQEAQEVVETQVEREDAGKEDGVL